MSTDAHQSGHDEPARAYSDAGLRSKGFALAATYDYRDQTDDLRYQKLRYEKPANGSREKTFVFRHPDGSGGWYSGRGSAPVPYRLPHLTEAADETIWICEGEKDADALAALGLIATSFDIGGESVAEACAPYFDGREILIIPDNDAAGRKRLAQTIAALNGIAATIRVIKLTDLGDGEDVSDWLAKGHGLDDLMHEMEDAEVVDDEPSVEEAPKLRDIQHWADREPAPTEFLVESIIPINCVTLLTADGGVGKSILAQVIATHTAKGQALWGLAIKKGAVVGVFAEDDERILQFRHSRICEAYDIFHGDVASLLHFASFVGMDMELWRNEEPTQKCREIEDYLERHPDVRLLILDNVADVFGGNENIRREVRMFIQRLTALGRRHDLAVLLLAHSSKSQGQQAYLAASGSTAWVNSCRSVLRLSADKDNPRNINLEHLKSNYSAKTDPIPLMMKGAALVPASQSDFEAADFDQLDAAVISNIKKLRNLGQKISTSRNAANFVGKIFQREAKSDFQNISVNAIWESVQRQIDAGLLDLRPHPKTGTMNIFLVDEE